MLEARKITAENLNAVRDISVREDQQALVASNAKTITEARDDPLSWMRGLWVGDEPVGLIAMIDLRADHPDREPGDPKDVAYLWRLMIAAAHQGKGYGRAAMDIAFAKARTWHRETLCVSVAETTGSAAAFYVRAGLVATDQINDGERLFMCPVPLAEA